MVPAAYAAVFPVNDMFLVCSQKAVFLRDPSTPMYQVYVLMYEICLGTRGAGRYLVDR